MPIDIHNATRLKELQALPLERKIAITQARIIEWFNFWEGAVYVSFSGGKDSTVLLDLVVKTIKAIDPTFEVPVVFSNTGLEYPEIQRFARDKGATFVTPKMNFVEVIKTYGYPLISKEVASAIYYARRIRPYDSGAACDTHTHTHTHTERGFKQTMFKRLELLGFRTTGSREQCYQRIQGNDIQATGTTRQTTSEQTRMGGQDEFRTATRKWNELLDQRFDSCSTEGYSEKTTHGEYG